MAVLNRAQILAPRELESETVSVPEWGGDVIVRALTGAERDQFEAGFVKEGGRQGEMTLENTRARLVALSVVDEHGQRLFSTDDIEMLGAQPAAALDRVFFVARRLSRLSNEDLAQLVKS